MGELAAALSAEVIAGPAAVAVTGISQDSRAVVPGDLYLARAGDRAHGATFAAAAVAAGAVAILTDPSGLAAARGAGVPVLLVPDARAAAGTAAAAVYGDPVRALRTVAVTGTNGKTTTTFLVDGGLRAAGCRTGLI
ncbi:MAG: UDP-N-acetylmuramoyl-L-alanyl-D-glutamate--2,6-diaminopimelate ligase, partial [Frankiaceae bacterium]|nr:UDP-N-acetylmuramoyl-L-alanyl-D-glutamate--2,6-diaminopimelate ligase [Frankiaceae bacterium]